MSLLSSSASALNFLHKTPIIGISAHLDALDEAFIADWHLQNANLNLALASGLETRNLAEDFHLIPLDGISTEPNVVNETILANEAIPEDEDETAPDLAETFPQETQVLITEVAVADSDGQPLETAFEERVYGVLTTRAGQTTTRSQIQQDINNIFSTGLFSNVGAVPSDTPLGVRVTFQAEPNPILSQVRLEGNDVLPNEIVEDIFNQPNDNQFPGYGEIINLLEVQNGILELNNWYQENGYVLAQVVAAPQVTEDGTITLLVAEGIIEDIEIRFLTDEGRTEDEEGNPIRGKTRDFIITREFETQPGDVFQQSRIQTDLQRAFGLGIFDDINLNLNPGEKDPRQVRVIVNVVERTTATAATGLGSNSFGQLFATASYSEDNVAGRGQKALFEVQYSFSETLLETSFNSVGNISRKSAENSLIHHEILAFIEAKKEGRSREAVDNLNEILSFSRQREDVALEILTLNNLGYFLEGSSAIEVYENAVNLLENYDDLALTSIIRFQQSDEYRLLGEPQNALIGYISVLQSIENRADNTSNSESVIESIFLPRLFQEWRLSETIGVDKINFLTSILETSALLDLSSAYSGLGDYQSALYVANSEELTNASQELSDNVSRSIHSDLRRGLLELFEANENTVDYIDYLLSGYESISSEVITDASKIYSFFTQSNFTEDSIQYEEVQEKAFALQSGYFDQLLYLALDILSNERFLNNFSDVSDSSKEALSDIRTLLPEAFDVERASWNEVILRETIQKYLYVLNDLFFNDMGELFAFESQELDTSFNSPIVDDLFNEVSYALGKIIAQEDLPTDNGIDLSFWRKLLEVIPAEVSEHKSIGLLESLLLQQQGNKLISSKDHESAISVYRKSLDTLVGEYNSKKQEEGKKEAEAETISTSSDFIAFDETFSIPSSPDEAFENQTKLNNFLDQIDSLFFSIPVVSQKIVSSLLRVGDLSLKINEPEQAKYYYSQIFNYLEDTPQGGGSSKRQALSAEAKYGIAKSEIILRNVDDSIKYIEKAISEHEKAFPYDSLSGGQGFFQPSFLYGYGIPYAGLISARFSLNAESIQALDVGTNQKSQYPCSTSAEYFACKQKYFDLYIEALLAKHKKYPQQGFDQLAFAASERARVFDISSPQKITADESDIEHSRLIQQALESIDYEIPEETLVISFFLGEDKSYLWLVNSEKELLTYDNLPPRKVIEEKAQEFYDLLTSPVGRIRPETTTKVGAELSDMLLGSIKEQLDTKRLVIIADGFLQYLPFGALPNPKPDTALAESALSGEYAPFLQPLLLDHEIVYLPSLSALVELRERAATKPAPNKELALFANPVFNHKDNRVKQVKLYEGAEPFSAAELDDIQALYSQLPNTERELEIVLQSDLLSESDVQTFFGFDANLENALSSNLGEFRIVHFASHGIFNSNAPQRSGVVLSSLSEDGVVQSGLLSPTYAFNDMNLSATELVVLSGCRTGLSEGQVGREGMTGLTSGLFEAGADRVVASLWSVQDDATRELMKRFYERMLDPENPMRPAAALRDAQISMWNEPKWQTPYNWAAFTLQGEWR